jgi:hypothetical protein
VTSSEIVGGPLGFTGRIWKPRVAGKNWVIVLVNLLERYERSIAILGDPLLLVTRRKIALLTSMHPFSACILGDHRSFNYNISTCPKVWLIEIISKVRYKLKQILTQKVTGS